MAILKPLPSSGRGKHNSSITTATSTTSSSNGHRPRRRRTSTSHDDDHDHDAPNRNDTAGVMTSATSTRGSNQNNNNHNNNNDNNDNTKSNHRHPDDTPYLHGVRLLDTFLAPPTTSPSSRVPAVLTAAEATGLRQIRQLLLSAHIREDHIPSEIRPGGGGGTGRDGDETDGGGGVTQYLVQEFGGVRKKPSLKKVARSVLNSLRFIQNARSA
eukprot:CAMPEP_0171370112 /NCGR_PEP_ID=MMETSP0879-20121228/7811_1 /TAXON_ID=67004 /ORGANISM="Thalassiosira weissflogii, Strain CCMP1336" /LENGTH=212 /DNA_ID=CAMNT_0011878537 /DNA_START=35 /DNA_END=669 /DNA_ORIENTATION=-